MTQVVTKIWHLLDEISGHDLETLQRAGVSFSIVRDDYPIDAFGAQSSLFVQGKTDVQITTRCDEQESWLKLCFGSRLMHFSTCYDVIY